MSTSNPVSPQHNSNDQKNQFVAENAFTLVLNSPNPHGEETVQPALSPCNFDTLQKAIANLATSMQDIKSEL
jgi:hypothetical protein